MSTGPYRVLVVEDNTTMREGIVEVLARENFHVESVSSGVESLERLQRQPFDLVITDYKMSPLDGLAVLKSVKDITAETDVVLITAFGTVDVAVEAMKLGAVDFITKPFSPDELQIRIDKILNLQKERRRFRQTDEENRYLREEIQDKFNFGEIVGRSTSMVEVFQLVKKSAESDSSVVIYGESGTGKELIARAIHSNSMRREKPFIKVNCAALTETLLESELFGHEKGAFTGAIKTRKGRFELADTGTLFLDEIGDISPNVQVKLLRAIQEQEFERVGGEVTLNVNTRIIAATNKNLPEAMRTGSFREDLYYRLNVIPIELPPLRERKDDIPRLVDFFVHKLERDLGRKHLSVDPSVYALLMDYGWPGNVRELENIVERAVVLSGGERLEARDFAFLGNQAVPREPAFQLEDVERNGLVATLEMLEKTMIEKALEKTNGGRSEAARLLGLKTSAFYYKLEKYELL